MEEKLVKYLLQNKFHIATVESCTGGLIASKLVNVSGASNVFEYGFVTYSNKAKNAMVNVPEDIFEKYGAVSRECAMAMAKGGKAYANADVCISVTGVAGPNMDEGKEVGLVYIGISYTDDRAYEFHFTGDRSSIRESAAQKGIELALKTLKGDI